MAYSVNFAGVELDNYCKVLKVKRSVLPGRTNFSKSIPAMNGSYYTGFHFAEKEIALEVVIEGKSREDFMKNAKRLAGVLNVSKPHKIFIDDEPGVYYYAIPDGTTELERSVFSGTTTITFVCHNPVGYSENWNTYSPNNRGIIQVENYGTCKASPLMEVTFNKSACFFQATNRQGETLLLGLPKDMAKPTIPETNILVNDNCSSRNEFTTLSPSLLPNGYTADGSFGVGFNGNGIVCTNYGSGSNWHGTAFRKTLPTDVDEFEVSIDLVFSAQGKNYEIPNPTPIPPGVGGSGSSYGKWKVVNCGGLWINSEPNDRTPVYAMSPGTIIYPTEIQGNWYKHTHKAQYGTYTGWSYGRYLKKVDDNTFKIQKDAEIEYAEEELGTLEVYGFDRSGGKLFDFKVSDTSEYFEHVNPVVTVGNTTLIKEDTVAGKSIRQETVGEGESATQQNAASGAVGRWNDLTGTLIIRREKNSNGQHLWSATLNKFINGALVETLTNKNALVSSNSQSPLSYLGFFIGQFGDKRPVDIMAIDNISVKKLNIKNDVVVGSNLSLFNSGDHLQIDFERGEALLNGQSIMDKLDIGSQFFEIPVGSSDFMVKSDDDTMVVCAGIQEKFL